MSEDNAESSGANGQTAAANEPVEIVNVNIKIEKFDSDLVDEQEIEIKIEPALEKNVKVEPDLEINVKAEPGVETCSGNKPALSFTENEEGAQSDNTPSRRQEKQDLSCSLCGRNFRRSATLTSHMRNTHGETKPGTYTCQLCQRSFSHKEELINHLRGSNCTVKQLYKCSFCQHEFKTEPRLRKHINTYHTERPHECELCGKRFRNDGAVFRHQLRHENESSKQFPCTVCGKAFAIVNALECHLRTHTKEQPFKCSVCVRAFSHKHNMMRHMRRHERVIHLKCEICQKEFPTESRLKYHMRVHWTNNKPYQCRECPKTYSHLQNIMRHYKKKHPYVEYIPPATDAEFANKAWKLRMEQSEDQGYILPEIQQEEVKEDLHKKEENSDMEVSVKPELVLVNC